MSDESARQEKTTEAYWLNQGLQGAPPPIPQELIQPNWTPLKKQVFAAHLNSKKLKRVALKRIPWPTDNRVQDTLSTELKVLEKVQSPYLISYYGNFVENSGLYLILQLAVCSLDQILPNLPISYAITTLLGIAKGLAVLHSNQISHQNLKPQNILIDPALHVKITDFGLEEVKLIIGKKKGDLDNLAGKKGTLNYKAPEQFTEKGGFSADVYSLGLVAWSLATGKILYDEKLDFDIMLARCAGDECTTIIRKLPPSVTPYFEKFIQDCCIEEPAQLWSAATAADVLHELIEQEYIIIHPVELTQVINKVKERLQETMAERATESTSNKAPPPSLASFFPEFN